MLESIIEIGLGLLFIWLLIVVIRTIIGTNKINKNLETMSSQLQKIITELEKMNRHLPR